MSILSRSGAAGAGTLALAAAAPRDPLREVAVASRIAPGAAGGPARAGA